MHNQRALGVDRVLGVDLAASAANTAAAVLDGMRVVALESDVDDDDLDRLRIGAAQTGIDCPLGWPRDFVRFVQAHEAGAPVAPTSSVADRAPLAYRATDRWVAAHQPPLRPLSVSADRIGHAAFRCAGLLARWGVTDRSGASPVAEVYPAGSLHAWGLPYRRYKGAAGREVRERLVDALGGVVEFGEHETACRRSDHALDAVLCAVTVHAVLHGMYTRPAAEQRAAAEAEGWIAIPTCALETLSGLAGTTG